MADKSDVNVRTTVIPAYPRFLFAIFLEFHDSQGCFIIFSFFFPLWIYS